MKYRFKKTGYLLLFMALGLLLIPTLSQAQTAENDYIVKDLLVEDVPNNDGTGLAVSWVPLPIEQRIIEYRIYRGVTPDSLFYVGKVDVNPETEFVGERMYFYDTDFTNFVTINSPGRLRQERQQPDDSPIFRAYPRDISVTGPELTNYTILGIITEKNFYYKNRKVVIEDEESDDESVYAGMKLRHIDMAKKLIPDHKYYYTVIAVDELRRFHPHAEPQYGIPRVNSPEKTREFYVKYLEDQKQLNFEWSLPLFTDDVYYHQIYMLSQEDLEQFKAYEQALIEREEHELARKEDPEMPPYEMTVDNPAELIFMRYSAYPYTGMRNKSISVEDERIYFDKTFSNAITGQEFQVDVPIDTDNIEDYYFVFSLFDTSGHETFSDVTQAATINSDILPPLSDFKVVDRKDDKGEYNTVYWDNPVVYLTNATYLDLARTKMMVNYELMENENYYINNIYFDVYDESGEHIGNINEFYQDNRITFRIPTDDEDYDRYQDFSFEITIRANGEMIEDYVLTQKIEFNEMTRSLRPTDLHINGFNVENFFYYIYKRNYADEEFRLSQRLAATAREHHDMIRFENNHFKIVNQYEEDRDLFLISPSFAVMRDPEKDATVSSNLYRSEFEKTVERYESEIERYQAMLDTVETEAEKAQARSAINYYQNQLEISAEHPVLDKAESFESDRQRIKFLDKVRHYARNSFEYKMVFSNGEGVFVETPIFVADEPMEKGRHEEYVFALPGWGETHFYPLPNWFKTDWWPALIATFIFGLFVYIYVKKALRGHDMYIRPIAGIHEIDNAIGRATEMGKPILFIPGLSGIQDVATLAGLAILGRVAKKAAEYDTRILVPMRDYIVLPIAQEIVKEAHYEAGRPDTYDKNSVFFVTTNQFAFVAGVNGIMVREKVATNFFMGMFWAEALLLTETGNIAGAVQIAGTDAITQIPFFITTCDYTLLGEELYAAAAYLARDPLQMGTLKGVDYTKLIIMSLIVGGTILSTSHLTFLINAFPDK